MAEPEELRPKKLKNTLGPRNWREKEFLKERKIVSPYLTYQEAVEGSLRFFNKCQLRYGLDGKKYRTEIPRPMPSDDWEYKNKKRGRADGEVY